MINTVHKIGQTHIKDIAANAAKILTCVWPFCGQ